MPVFLRTSFLFPAALALCFADSFTGSHSDLHKEKKYVKKIFFNQSTTWQAL